MIEDIKESVKASVVSEKRVADALHRWFPDNHVEHQHDGEFGTDVSISFRGLRLCFGVEQIDAFGDKDLVYPYPCYPLSTDKRARKMVSCVESVLFVVNGPIGCVPDRYMLIFPSSVPLDPEIKPLYSRSGPKKKNRHPCPWGCTHEREYRFMVPRTEVRMFSDPFPFDLLTIVRDKLNWTGPKVMYKSRV